MPNKYEKYRDKAFSAEVWQLLKNALDEGIDIDDIADERYDYDQIKELLIAKKNHVDVTPFLDPSIPAQTMHKIRESIFKEMGIYEEHYERVRKKWIKNISGMFILVLLIAGTILLCFAFQEDIEKLLQNIDINIKEKMLVVEAGEAFDPYKNVIDYNDGSEIKVKGMDGVDTHKVGNYKIRYIVTNGKKKKEVPVVVRVVDTIKPKLMLSTDKINVEKGTRINPMDYVIGCEDVADGDLKKSVKYFWNGMEEIVYSVVDKAGNKEQKKITVSFFSSKIPQKKQTLERPSKKDEVIHPDRHEDNEHRLGNTPIKAENKYFPFEEGKNFEDTHAQCDSAGENALKQGRANGYRCTIRMDDDEIPVGYDLTFK